VPNSKGQTIIKSLRVFEIKLGTTSCGRLKFHPFTALSQICTKEYRNVVISFNIPIAFLVGGGVVPHILSVLGEQGHFSTGFILFGILIFAGSITPFF